MRFKNCFECNINKKKFLLCVIFIICALLSTFCVGVNVIADDGIEHDNIKELSQIVGDIVNGIDLSDIEDIISDVDNINFFDNSVKDKIADILDGDYFINYSSIFSAIVSLVFVDIKEFIPFLFTLLAIGVLANLIGEFSSDKNNTNDIIHFVCFSVMVIVIMVSFKEVLSVTSGTLSLIMKQIQIVFPILITLLSAIGSFSTISIYNPLVAILSTLVSVVFEKFLYPMFIIMFIFSIIGHLTETVKLDKMQGFLSSSFKWIVGIVFTLFTGFLSIQGISAGRFDSVSIKATKFAVKSYIPIIGGYISDGMDFIVLGSVLVKNTIGLVGIIVLFLSIVSPIITMVVMKLGLQLCSAILELGGGKKMSSFLGSCSKILVYPIVLILGISFMYVITIALIMCTANIF
jgi:stage III sporulation protein AE